MATYFELDPCNVARLRSHGVAVPEKVTGCSENRWRLGVRDPKTGKTEFICFACGSNTYVRLSKEAYTHLAGGD